MLIENKTISEYFVGTAFLADDLFGGLPAETAKSLRAAKQTKRFAKDETIFTGGQMPSGIYVLLEGRAQLFYNGGGRTRSIKQNEILGLTEAIAELPYETSVKTVAPCIFEYIGREDFIGFLQNEPEICFRLLQRLGANLQKLYKLFR